MHPSMIKKNFFCQKYVLQARFLMQQNAPQARLIKENAPQASFFN